MLFAVVCPCKLQEAEKGSKRLLTNSDTKTGPIEIHDETAAVTGIFEYGQACQKGGPL